MKFFVPYVKDKKQEINFYDAIKKFAKETMGRDIKDRKIYHIKWRHGREDHEAKVGEIQTRQNEPVMAILESKDIFFVCTPNRGAVRGMPILVGRKEIISVTDFDE